ncbi:hypothetical protein [Rudaeicoccus suwonensis]|uniref:Uncharacterized protein n=1 Tax=Rudaeicoccus suwonensis TaxID=657409 RepID=A0A561E7G9_9MICO|nr:hypothetical protein [Rudaeicoccus suwonensis]TWE11558.1 hypothetical protein BKA23_0331 [Rudaeicoccus suwonensis]
MTLILGLLPLVLLASISPVIFLNASSVAASSGARAVLRFVVGNAIVLTILGTLSLGLLGAAAASFAQRELASRTADGILAALLLAYGARLLVAEMHHQRAADRSMGTAPAPQGLVSWGVLGMATNFTTLPLYIAVAQRLGSSTLPGWLAVVTLAVVTVLVLTPAWLPGLLVRVAPAATNVSPQTRAKVAASTRAASIVACLLGSIFLLWHVVSRSG